MWLISVSITAPTATRDVLLVNTSSTSLHLTWEPPICDNGIRTGYIVRARKIHNSSNHCYTFSHFSLLYLIKTEVCSHSQ